MPSVSIVIPVLNEAASIGDALDALRGVQAEVIVVDGGSVDGTVERVEDRARVVRSPAGRARQQNAGAAAANGDVLLFLHADTRLPARAVDAVRTGGRAWGRFDVRLSGAHPAFRLVERMISLRSRLSGIATGDQAIFVRADLFRAVGGFPEIPLMEDVALSRLLLRHGRPDCLRLQVTTSSRRWERAGILRTILLMWRLRLEYWLGRDPAALAARYR